jgi:hypothetical protein
MVYSYIFYTPNFSVISVYVVSYFLVFSIACFAFHSVLFPPPHPTPLPPFGILGYENIDMYLSDCVDYMHIPIFFSLFDN